MGKYIALYGLLVYLLSGTIYGWNIALNCDRTGVITPNIFEPSAVYTCTRK